MVISLVPMFSCLGIRNGFLFVCNVNSTCRFCSISY
jgi:hypothetical protein